MDPWDAKIDANFFCRRIEIPIWVNTKPVRPGNLLKGIVNKTVRCLHVFFSVTQNGSKWQFFIHGNLNRIVFFSEWKSYMSNLK